MKRVLAFIIGLILTVCVGFTAFMCVMRYLYGPFTRGESKPYAVKQNGDTLFIPTQVVIKHDTLVVIRTEERRPVQDSIEAANWTFTSTGGITSWSVDTSAMLTQYSSMDDVQEGGYYVFPKKKYSPTRDTIYEHKIIYY